MFADFFLALWAVIPPLLLLAYYWRVAGAPSPQRLLLFFILGAISGLIALGLQWAFETTVGSILNWRLIQRSLLGIALRQLVVIAPIEEGCKLAAVFLPIKYLLRPQKLTPSTIFLFALAVSLGFAAQENCIYLYYGTASISDRLIGTPVHAMFSAPWGYALAVSLYFQIRIHRYTQSVTRAWLNSVICHSLVNILSSAGRYPIPLQYLSYVLFPFLLWMFWRLEQLFRRVQGKYPITLISGHTTQQRYWQRGLVLFILILGGNAIFGLFLLARIISPLSLLQIFSARFFSPILTRFLLNLLFGLVAWGIYLYLRYAARR
ncbi:MAG: PrsW family intramembrane metalloprotease [Cyanomargarita calcarea GSE-NOS-MK-12-04C]|uniref:PrsW family intramembrane metalloprotease n=1 Tax=Cyanomargarita calcarea GSE-NOS-MK-12-04C TaxID=2839659 RepID=A0A951QR25_9CYAN|nr:PrsW family intramembrane metalloprotease [Cyanomargarita calcarea GSE-NOS-MK-12-04C]